MILEERFESLKQNSSLSTAYPLHPSDWEKHRVESFDILENINELSIYIHIPFCTNRCKFCEYTTFSIASIYNQEDSYIESILQELHNTKQTLLYGFDIGGGTPTALSNKGLSKLLYESSNYISKSTLIQDFEASIESDYQNLTTEKINIIKDSLFKRVSIGIQSSNKHLLTQNARKVDNYEELSHKIGLLKQSNIKVNLDIMYGIEGMTTDDIVSTLIDTVSLFPNQITLYEMRYNSLNKTQPFSREELIEQYKLAYALLINAGYEGHFGSNTFTLDASDKGLSSYLKYRMLHFKPYKGIGISAQSMSDIGLSYNKGKGIKHFSEAANAEEYYYRLPLHETLAKYISIGLYNGSINIGELESRFSIDISKQLNFLVQRGLALKQADDFLYLTEEGFKHYGAIGALIYTTLEYQS